MSERRHWFHCTTAWRGARWVAVPRVPNYVPHEPSTPRLCVASSVARCFAARLFRGDVFVYRTETPRRSINPGRDVADAIITRERWLVPPVAMIFDRVIPAELVEKASGPTWARLEAIIAQHPEGTPVIEMRGLTHGLRAQSFLDAVLALGPECTDAADLPFATFATSLLQRKRA